MPLGGVTPGSALGTASLIIQAASRAKEARVGRRVGGRGSQERAKGRVRGRVRERVQGGAGRKRGTLDVGAIEGYADRLTDHVGGASRLAGAASGLAAGGFAHRILGSNTEGSEQDLGTVVRERLDLVDERLQRLEDQMRTILEGGADPGNLEESGDEPDSHSNR
jgi:hypothetical protein